MQGATEGLSRFVANTRLEDIPDRVVQNAKLLILDTVGVILAASRDSGCKLLAQWVKDQESAPRATVIGQGFRSSPLLAALVNGHAAHALDYDDSGHYSTQTLPAALALGEPPHVAGAKFIRAYVIGREVCNRLDAAFDASREKLRGPTFRGWHHTGTNGSLGAAAAAGVVLGLDLEQIRTAFGIAANGACGLRANMGTMTKALVSGNAARNGVMAATLAQRGFTAEKSVLETPQGIANAFCEESDIDWEAMTRDLGKSYELARGAITKDYPSCSPAHRPIEALLLDVNAEYTGDPFDLPRQAVRIVGVDLHGTVVDPKDLEPLGKLRELREVHLPARVWSPTFDIKSPFADEMFDFFANSKKLLKFEAGLTTLAYLRLGEAGLKRLARSHSSPTCVFPSSPSRIRRLWRRSSTWKRWTSTTPT